MTDEVQQEPGGEGAVASQQHPRGEVNHPEMHYPFGMPIQPPPPPKPRPLARFKLNPRMTYAVITIGAGVLMGAIFAIHARNEARTGPFDLGTASSDAQGLQGHLYTEWNSKLTYRLSIRPADASQQAGFALAVNRSPRPISFDIQVKDPLGFVLCSGDLVLPYDPAAAADASDAATPAQLQVQEAAREAGKALLHRSLSADGQVVSLDAQGTLPCSKSAYQRAAIWGFTTDFPSLAEQSALLKEQAEARAETVEKQHRAEAAQRRAKRRAVAAPLRFSVEGYDVVTWSDPALGVIGTESGKVFVIDEASLRSTAARWQVYPADIHYHCNQSAECVITRADSTMVLHAHLRR
jgi:hypothetical protein